MTRERVERRLAAILAADVAGYSRLMGDDEAGTLERLRAHRRELIDPKIAEHKGRIVKTTGDGMLIEFPSVVDAVRCAVEIQRAMVDRNTDIAEDKRITFRIGDMNSVAKVRAFIWYGNPQFQVLHDKTIIQGLRNIGFPEEVAAQQ